MHKVNESRASLLLGAGGWRCCQQHSLGTGSEPGPSQTETVQIFKSILGAVYILFFVFFLFPSCFSSPAPNPVNQVAAALF